MSVQHSLQCDRIKRLYKTLSDPKSERELLSVLLTILRNEKREEVDAEEASKELSSGDSRKQPDSKKQTILGER